MLNLNISVLVDIALLVLAPEFSHISRRWLRNALLVINMVHLLQNNNFASSTFLPFLSRWYHGFFLDASLMLKIIIPSLLKFFKYSFFFGTRKRQGFFHTRMVIMHMCNMPTQLVHYNLFAKYA